MMQRTASRTGAVCSAARLRSTRTPFRSYSRLSFPRRQGGESVANLSKKFSGENSNDFFVDDSNYSENNMVRLRGRIVEPPFKGKMRIETEAITKGNSKGNSKRDVRIGDAVLFEEDGKGVVVGFSTDVADVVVPLRGQQGGGKEISFSSSSSSSNSNKTFSLGNAANILDESFDLSLPKPAHQSSSRRMKKGTPSLKMNHGLLDLLQLLKLGQRIAFFGNYGDGKTYCAQRLLAGVQDEESESEIFVVCGDHSRNSYEKMTTNVFSQDLTTASAAEHAWLTMLKGIQAAAKFSEKKHTILVLDDLVQFNEVANPKGYHTIISLLNAAMDLAGVDDAGKTFTVVANVDSFEGAVFQAVESFAEVCLPLENQNFGTDRVAFGKSIAGNTLRERILRDAMEKIRKGHELSVKVGVMDEVQLFVDDWEREELTSTFSAEIILNRWIDEENFSQLDLLFVARAATIFHFTRMATDTTARVFIRSLIERVNEVRRDNKNASSVPTLAEMDDILLRVRYDFELTCPKEFENY